MLKLRYWRKIVTMKDSRLVKTVYNEEVKVNEDKTWSSRVRKLLKKMDLIRYWKTQMITETEDEWNKVVEESINRHRDSEWRRSVEAGKKLDTYRMLEKKTQKKEEYLDNLRDVVGRSLIFKMRSGSNFLEVDKGRENDVDRKDYSNQVVTLKGVGICEARVWKAEEHKSIKSETVKGTRDFKKLYTMMEPTETNPISKRNNMTKNSKSQYFKLM